MSTDFVTRELYGGTITAQLPADVIDASDLRQIPDHQEVFLSDKTLTSIIFEINEYQTESSITSTVADNAGSADDTAAFYHFSDLIEAPDHLSSSEIQTTPVKLPQSSVSKYPAYQSSGTIVSPELDRFVKSTLPLTWQTDPAKKEYYTGTLQLLVRMQDQGTDLCVRINVPLRELGNVESEAAQTEVNHASEVMKKIIETIDIKDFGLFGPGE